MPFETGHSNSLITSLILFPYCDDFRHVLKECDCCLIHEGEYGWHIGFDCTIFEIFFLSTLRQNIVCLKQYNKIPCSMRSIDYIRSSLDCEVTLFARSTICISTHWGRMPHICVSKLTVIGLDNGLSPGRRQAIIWTNAPWAQTSVKY